MILPRTTPGSSTRPSSERLSTVFPDPLAPTMATESPLSTENDTPRTACTTPQPGLEVDLDVGDAKEFGHFGASAASLRALRKKSVF